VPDIGVENKGVWGLGSMLKVPDIKAEYSFGMPNHVCKQSRGIRGLGFQSTPKDLGDGHPERLLYQTPGKRRVSFGGNSVFERSEALRKLLWHKVLAIGPILSNLDVETAECVKDIQEGGRVSLVKLLECSLI